VFRNTAVTNLQEFFGRFASLNLHSDAQLDELVERARRLVGGVPPQAVRGDDGLRRPGRPAPPAPWRPGSILPRAAADSRLHHRPKEQGQGLQRRRLLVGQQRLDLPSDAATE
jgi:hypothetical protein